NRASGDEFQAFVGVIRRRYVTECQRYAGDHLNRERNERGAANGVVPSRRRHRMFDKRLDGLGIADSVIQPAQDRFHACEIVCVNECVWTCTRLLSTMRTLNWRSGRGGGPPATLPSA